MAVRLSTTIRDAMGNSIINSMRNCKLYITTEEVPIGQNMNSQGGNVLSEHLMDGGTPASMSNGVMTFNSIKENSMANKTGEATHACIASNNGIVIATMTVTSLGGGGDLQMNTTSIVEGGPVRFTSLTWTMPAA